MKKSVQFVVVFLSFAMAASGFCQIRQGAFSVSPFIGGYTFEGNQNLQTQPVYGLRGGYDFTKHFGAELLFDYVSTKYTEADNQISADALHYRLEGLYHFMPEKRLVPFIAVGAGGQNINYSSGVENKTKFAADYGAGLKYFITDDIALRADMRHVIVFGSAYNNLEYTVGLSFLFGGGKGAQSSAKGSEPSSLQSSAKDSSSAITEGQKKEGAKTTAVVKEREQKNEPAAGAVVAREDEPKKEDVSSKAATDEELRKKAAADAARDEELRKKAAADAAAAAAAAARDEELRKKAAADAAAAREMVEKGRGTIHIRFDFDKADVKPAFHQELEKFAKVMEKYRELKFIIEGHADNIGEKDYNQNLSIKRADSVKTYLIKEFGIEKSRLRARGYGMSKPIADNKTLAGRQKNRRVEAVVDYTITK